MVLSTLVWRILDPHSDPHWIRIQLTILARSGSGSAQKESGSEHCLQSPHNVYVRSTRKPPWSPHGMWAIKQLTIRRGLASPDACIQSINYLLRTPTQKLSRQESNQSVTCLVNSEVFAAITTVVAESPGAVDKSLLAQAHCLTSRLLILLDHYGTYYFWKWHFLMKIWHLFFAFKNQVGSFIKSLIVSEICCKSFVVKNNPDLLGSITFVIPGSFLYYDTILWSNWWQSFMYRMQSFTFFHHNNKYISSISTRHHNRSTLISLLHNLPLPASKFYSLLMTPPAWHHALVLITSYLM